MTYLAKISNIFFRALVIRKEFSQKVKELSTHMLMMVNIMVNFHGLHFQDAEYFMLSGALNLGTS